jgi:hypothetical protein
LAGGLLFAIRNTEVRRGHTLASTEHAIRVFPQVLTRR